MSRYPATVTERFWPKVVRSDGCWTWTASTTVAGYGKISVGAGRLMLAHRLSWEMHNGSIPEGLCVCHRCDNPRCVRPDHLFLGTVTENNRDMVAKGRNRTPFTTRTHCRRGHEFTPSNTLVSQGCRYCRICKRERGRRVDRNRYARRRHSAPSP